MVRRSFSFSAWLHRSCCRKSSAVGWKLGELVCSIELANKDELAVGDEDRCLFRETKKGLDSSLTTIATVVAVDVEASLNLVVVVLRAEVVVVTAAAVSSIFSRSRFETLLRSEVMRHRAIARLSS